MVLHPLIFNLKVSLGLKWVSCKQHIDGSCFLIHSVTLCLLIGALGPLTFRVITKRYEFIDIMLLVELEFLVVFSVPFQSLLLLVCMNACIYLFFHLFTPQRIPLQISCRAGLVVTNSFNFCLGNFLSLLLLEWQPCWKNNFGCTFFLIQHTEYILPLFYGLPSSVGTSAANLICFPL